MPDFISLYRKYRPQTFTEVRGQDHVVSVLRGAISKGAIGHAYLFHGSRGIGKTTIARIFAREIGCAPEDIYEIDGASNRKIEDARALRETVQTLPFNSPYKVYIIDEVHMLTKEAFNVLLKTLEEPPPYVIFMLATTEYEKLPETIISRCQVFTLRKPSLSSLIELVLDACKKEKVHIEQESAELIALLGDGSYRDALGLVQKVMNVSVDDKISHSEVERVTGAPSFTLVQDFLKSIVNKDIESALRQVNLCVEHTIDMDIFLRRVIHTVRMILLARFSQQKKKELEATLPKEQWSFVSGLIGAEGASLNANFLVTLLDASIAVRRATIPELPVELACIQILGQNVGV